ncbi:GNAT family N-acetyltransferase [Tumebacillus sp. ITR2]|uniref:GNAT family N-acetyltransferase n=1 Tax=Tumebacillus amylolyticus TaxID=2801339 RepID=A0ABS1JGD1_9BACL|nr:bifunctional GNAT family N-acetyltransferase/GrpB family protein [Tumebacillus amylolyticus]MBL0389326.1 GNAT family N-acetyltransferase [Tumebacillus amylolyticus]
MLTFCAIDPERDRALIVPNRRDSFVASFGTDESYGRDEDYLSWLAMRREQFPLGQVLAFEGRECVGQLELTLREGGQMGYVNLYYLRPEYRGRGYGKRLHEYVEQFFRPFQVQKLELRVAQTNARAIRFYEKMGFEVLYEEELREHKVYRMRKDLREKVEIVEYDPAWAALYELERDALVNALGEDIAAIEHIGSTAVPGLGAKPILDIQIGLREMVPAIVFEERLQRMGYRHHPTADDPTRRHFFVKGMPRTHHLHIVPADSWDWERHVLFRDLLREQPETRTEYEELKQHLAMRFGQDRGAYTEGKTAFIEGIIEKAKQGRA